MISVLMLQGWFSLFALTATAESGNWPQFRGPDGQGHAEGRLAPLKWSESENIAWKSALPGKGWSSPVVWGEQIWLTTAVETPADPAEAKRKLAHVKDGGARVLAKHIALKAICLDKASGKIVHEVSLFDVDDPDPIHTLNSYASPTPVIEPGRVYCHFGTYGTACVDTQSGEAIWKNKLPLEHEVGPGSSPILVNDLLILVCDGCNMQYIAALDKKTGTTAWKTNRPPIRKEDPGQRKAFCTPLVIHAAGREQMIIPGAQWIVSYDPATGKPIWQVDHGDGYSVVTRPVYGHGMVFFSTAFNEPSLVAVRVDGEGDVTKTHIAWRATRSIPKKPSPLLVEDELYVVSDTGITSCFDARSGKMIWQEHVQGNYSASPIFADGRIYVFNEKGLATVLAAGQTFKKLAENPLDNRIMATPAVVDAAMFLRTETHLYRIESK